MKVVLTLVLSFLFQNAFGATVLSDVAFNKSSKKGIVTLKFNQKLLSTPELQVKKNTILIKIPRASINAPIVKKVNFSTANNLDTTITAVKNNSAVEIKVKSPFNIEKKQADVFLKLEDNAIELSFPRVLIKAPAVAAVKKNTQKIESNEPVKKEYLNEKYLDSLLDIKKEDVQPQEKIIEQKTEKKGFLENKAETKKESDFSLVGYAGKFVAFLGMVLLLFYGVVSLMKKGFIKKAKLGFLHNSDAVSVVSQTYIGPKKSLMLVKAHNQVFLVSNTDAGIHPISEIKDAAGLFKSEEKSLSGTNFDTNLNIADVDSELESRIQLKEDITQSNRSSAMANYSDVKEKVTFSQQIKQKAKKLKQLQ